MHKNSADFMKIYRKNRRYAQKEEKKFVTCIQEGIYPGLLPLTKKSVWNTIMLYHLGVGQNPKSKERCPYAG